MTHALDSTAAPSGADDPAGTLPPAGDGPGTDGLALAVGVLWTLVTAVVLVLMFGGPGHRAFQAPDEAANAHAIERIAETGRPWVVPPADDPTTFTRQRMWVTVETADGEVRSPTSVPFFYVLHGYARRLPFGAWSLFVVPALGVGALAAASVLALRSVAGALVPLLAFPALYWFLHPWHNVALELAFVCFAALAATLAWRCDWAPGAGLALVAMTLAAVTRPDHVALLLGLTLLLGWFGLPARRAAVVGAHVVAGVAWVGANLWLNLVSTGDPFTLVTSLNELPEGVGLAGRSLPSPLAELVVVLAPDGLPGPSLLATQAVKYGLRLGGGLVGVVLVAAVAGLLVRFLHRRTETPIALVTATMLLTLAFAVTRISDSDLGAAAADPQLVHSYPRYAAVAYLLLGFAAAAAATLPRSRRGRTAALVALAAVAGAGGLALVAPQARGEGLSWMAGTIADAEDLAAAIDAAVPADAVVYSRRSDKYLWAVRPTGLLRAERVVDGAPEIDVERVVASVESVVDAGRTAVLFGVPGPTREVFAQRLSAPGRCLSTLDAGLPTVEGIPTAEPLLLVAECA